MSLLLADKVRDVIRDEVVRAGSQLGWAKRNGTRASDVNKILRGKKLPPRAILDAVALQKVAAYRRKKPSSAGKLIGPPEVVELIKHEIKNAGNQSEWARVIGARQSDINNALLGRRLPVKAILDALGLEKIVAYARHSGHCESVARS